VLRNSSVAASRLAALAGRVSRRSTNGSRSSNSRTTANDPRSRTRIRPVVPAGRFRLRCRTGSDCVVTTRWIALDVRE